MGFWGSLFGGKSPERKAPAPAAGDIHGDATEKEVEEASWLGGSGVPQELAASEVLQMLESGDGAVLVDVREAHEREADGWIPGSVHIPMTELEQRLGELDPAKPVVVYCATGMRSMDVGAGLLERGFRDVSNLNGGIAAWKGPKETMNAE